MSFSSCEGAVSWNEIDKKRLSRDKCTTFFNYNRISPKVVRSCYDISVKSKRSIRLAPVEAGMASFTVLHPREQYPRCRRL